MAHGGEGRPLGAHFPAAPSSHLHEPDGGDFATIGFDDDGPTWMFVHAEDPGTGRNRVLLDLDGGAEWRAQADRVEALGARREGEHEVPGVAHWVEFGDPEGNTFRIFAPRPA